MPSLRLAGRYKNLAKFREYVTRAAKEAGLDEDGVYACQLAVDEACTNIIEHGYQGEGKGDIECSCRASRGGLEIILRDWGQAFDPREIPEPDLNASIDEMNLRGAGIYLIRQMMDEVSFEFSPSQGNTTRMYKK